LTARPSSGCSPSTATGSAGVISEVPTNPLIQTPDVPWLTALAHRHGRPGPARSSIHLVFNLDVLPHADVVVSSLTKYAANEGDLTRAWWW